MKTLIPIACLLLALTNCGRVSPEPIDPLTQVLWCQGEMTYQFDSFGLFKIKSNNPMETWGGSWSYGPNHTQVNINLHYGPNRRIQLIRLENIQCTKTTLTAQWTDEIAQEIPFKAIPVKISKAFRL